MTSEERDELIIVLASELDTRDKRYMFFRMEFKQLLPLMNIEGSPSAVAWEIYSMFDKQQMLGSLIATLNVKFDCKLKLTF